MRSRRSRGLAPLPGGRGQADGGQAAARTNDGLGTEAIDQAIAEDAPEGHRDAERGEADGGDRRGGTELVAQVDRAPVGRRALDEQAGEGQRTEREQPPRGTHEDRLGVAHRVGVAPEEAP
jgi:hypothetical protein